MSDIPNSEKLYYSVHELEQFPVKERRVFGDLRLETEIDGIRYRYWLMDSGIVFIETPDKQGQWKHFGAYDGCHLGERTSGHRSL
jgi:hypothetical protein